MPGQRSAASSGVSRCAAHPFSTKVFGSDAAAEAAAKRMLDRFADPTVYWHCTLFYVEGRVPG